MIQGKPAFVLGLVLTSVALLSPAAWGQRNRINGRINNGNRMTLRGHVHPQALPENDGGPVNPTMPLGRITLALQPSATQQADLEKFLAEQQDPSSANYHHWLTPEQYADRFGVSQDDVNQIVTWLESQHLTVTGVARGRNAISVTGDAAAVQQAFGTSIHRYQVNGRTHFANTTDPTIPAALQNVVVSIHGLNNFRMKPRKRVAQSLPAQPNYTSGRGNHYLAPDDVAAIYNIKPLYASGITGSGQKIAVVGQTDIDLADIRQFRTFFGLPANDPQVVLVPGSQDPGTNNDDLGEADLDLELSGAVARDATIIYVNSGDVMTSVQYAIDQNLAPVLSISYGSCEAQTLRSDMTAMQSWARQANAQGITWLAASGDSGAADCAGASSRFSNILSVDAPSSIPEVTGVGGTRFNEGSGNYWNTSNDANNASVLSYIPETSWNDSVADGTPSSTGGGASIYFAKPVWQTGTGVPSDGARDVPDVSLNASADHDGYLVFSAGSELVVGGTSTGAPTLAGVMALLNQYLGSQSGQGNINPRLYSLAQTTPSAFHDISTGDNIITTSCANRLRNCTPGSIGYSAGAGYDQATGLGTIDAFALIHAWGTPGSATGQGTTPAGPPAITAIGNAASYTQAYAPGELLTIYGTNLSTTTQTAGATPWPINLGGVNVTINGVAAPLYYVSSGQLNVQIPYEVPPNVAVTLTVTTGGKTASTSFRATAAAPGIFTDANHAPVPFSSAARGSVITLFITGAGIVPGVATGVGAPANAPQAQQNVAVSVGNVAAPVAFAGIPQGYIGVMQINYQVPAAAPLGPQPVVVSIGGVASPPATLTVTQ